MLRTTIQFLLTLFPHSLRQRIKQLFPSLTAVFERMLQSQDLAKQKQLVKLAQFLDEEADRNQLEVYAGRTGAGKLRIFSPLPPKISGIATFTHSLSEELQKHVEVSLRNSVPRVDSSAAPGVRSFGYGDDSTPAENLYMLGNGPDHIATWERIHREPGHILLHDVKLPDLPVLPEESKEWRYRDYNYKANFSAQRFPKLTKSIIVMSIEAKMMVETQRKGQEPEIPIHVLENGHPVLVEILETKTRSSRIKIATFGFQNAQKEPFETYRTMARICKATRGEALIAGALPTHLRLSAYYYWVFYGNKLRDLKIETKLTDKEFVSEMRSADLAVQLRRYSNGETSGLIPMLAALGVPSIVTDIGAFQELPSDIFMKVDRFAGLSDDQFSQIIQNLTSIERYQAWAQKNINWAKLRKVRDSATELLKILGFKPCERDD